MKILRFLNSNLIKKSIIAIMMTSTVFISTTAQAATFNDIESTHWAYSAIDRITNEGLMTGDSSGNFNPNDFISKFDTTVILARAAGYKYSDLTEDEQAEYAKIYDKYEDYINQFVERYERWNSSVNEEIAFLLDRGIYTEDDLNYFFRLVDGQDRMRALSREEACVFLVRLLGKQEEVADMDISDIVLFLDDESISPICKPYVYYLRSIGVITGDATSEASNFNPGSGATRAAFAIMLDKTLNLMPTDTQEQESESESDIDISEESEEQIIQGVISRLYTTVRAIYVSSQNEEYDGAIFPVSDSVEVKIDGNKGSFSNLQENMEFTASVKDGEIFTISATISATQSELPTQTDTPSETTETTEIPTSVEYTKLEGIVSSHKTDSNGNHIEIELTLINPRGITYTEKRTYKLSEDCLIYKDDVKSSFDEVKNGDIAILQINGNMVHSMNLENKNRMITGVITDKKYDSNLNVSGYIVKDENNREYALSITPTSLFKRDSIDMDNHTNIRVGDTVDVSTEYDKIIDLFAYSTKSTVDVWISEIYISAKDSAITVINELEDEKKYLLIANTVDVYSLRVGNKVRLRLDSWEVETVTLLQEAQTDFSTGLIYSYTNQSVTINNVAGSYSDTKSFTYDSNTIIVDSITGNRVTGMSFRNGMKIYVIYSSSVPSHAKSITILSY